MYLIFVTNLSYFSFSVVIGISGCETDAICQITIPFSICEDGLCECEQGYMSVNNGRRCQRRTLDDPCTRTSDCGVIDHSSCTQGECQCSIGYYQRSSTSCQEFELGDTGCDPGDCGVAISHSECISGRCECSFGYTQNGTECECVDVRASRCIIVELGVTNCTADALCQRYVTNSRCSDATDPQTCVCQDGYATVDSKTKCEGRGLNSTCRSDTDCVLVTNATCSAQRMCSCDDGFIEQVNTSSCVPVGRS